MPKSSAGSYAQRTASRPPYTPNTNNESSQVSLTLDIGPDQLAQTWTVISPRQSKLSKQRSLREMPRNVAGAAASRVPLPKRKFPNKFRQEQDLPNANDSDKRTIAQEIPDNFGIKKEADFVDKERCIAEKDAKLEETASELALKNETLQRTEAELGMTRATLAQMQAQLYDKDFEMSVRISACDQHTQLLADREAQLAESMQTVSWQQHQLAEQQHQFLDQQHRLLAQEGLLADKDNILAEANVLLQQKVLELDVCHEEKQTELAQKNEICRRMELELEAKRRNTTNQDAKFSELQKLLAERKSDLVEKESLLQARAAQLVKKDELLKTITDQKDALLKTTTNQKESTITSLKKELRAAEVNLNSEKERFDVLSVDLAGKDEKILQLESASIRQDEKFVQLNNAFNEKEEIICRMKLSVNNVEELNAQKALQLQQLNLQVDEHKFLVASQASQIQEHNAMIADLDQQLTLKEAEMKEKDKMIAHQARELAKPSLDRDPVIARKDRQISKQLAIIAECDDAMAIVQRQLRQKDNELSRQDKRIEGLKQRVKELSNEEREEAVERAKRKKAAMTGLSPPKTRVQKNQDESWGSVLLIVIFLLACSIGKYASSE